MDDDGEQKSHYIREVK